MNTHADKTSENKSQSVANSLIRQQSSGRSAFRFVDNTPKAIAQRKLQEVANNSPRAQQMRAYREMANNNARVAQLKSVQDTADEETIQMMYPNKMEASLADEIQESNTTAYESKYVGGRGPYVFGTEGFKKFINSGKMFKWIYGKKNGVVIVSPELKHSVAAGGADVITAGCGQLKDGSIWIDNDTGHYQTSLESLNLSLGEWGRLGYNVKIQERADFAAAFNRLGGGGGRKKLFGIF